MKSEGSATAAASWAGQRERSNLPALRAMRWIAVAAGRRATRLLLYPIALYFFFASRGPRRNSRRYLERALGRPPTWRDGYRHVYTFCATVLDRVYLLREQFDEFAFEDSGKEAILEPASRGEGLLACGAHFGSFEALRTVGVDKGLKVAMIMYEDNARLINDTLAAIAPNAELHTIPLGRLDAMLALRRWLEDGGLGGMLADRTLPGNNPQRSKTVVLPFLGTPALSADPFLPEEQGPAVVENHGQRCNQQQGGEQEQAGGAQSAVKRGPGRSICG